MWNTGFSFRQLIFNGFRLKGSWFILDIRKKVLSVRVVMEWNREVMDATSLEGFKAGWDGAPATKTVSYPHNREVGTRCSLRPPSTQTVLQLYDF